MRRLSMSAARRFLAEERGSLTTEFLLWVPVLAFWLVVSVAAFGAFQSRIAASNAAYTVADVVSRQVQVDDTFFDGLYALHGNLIQGTSPFITVRVTSVRRDDDGNELNEQEDYEILWSSGLGKVSAMQSGKLPLQFLPAMADGDTVLVIETAVAYIFFTDWLGAEYTVWRHVLAVRPRYVASVAKV